jgi:hypothetical protein
MFGYLPNFVMDNLWYVILVASLLTWPMAWLADGAFQHHGFGLLGNYLLLMIGSLGGAIWIMIHMGSAAQVMSAPQLPFFAALAGASALILSACLLKRFLVR